MSPIYKVLISVLVVAMAAGAHLAREAIGLAAPAWLLGALVVVMILGLWMFPEPRKGKPKA